MKNDPMQVMLLAIAVVVVVGVLAGRIARGYGQPAVVGEIIAGVLLGPSALGLLPGHLMTRLFTPDARHALLALGQVGLLVFMFVLGATMEHDVLSGRRKQVLSLAGVGLAVPFLTGLGIGLAVYTWWHEGVGPKATPLAFLLFLGADLAVTAFPVLARLLGDKGLQQTRLGSTCLATAAVIDLGTWLLLVLVVAVVRSSGPTQMVRLAAAAVFLALFTLYGVRPALRRLLRLISEGPVPAPVVAALFAGLLGMSWLTDALGLHQIFGAFLFGLAMPRESLRWVTTDVVAQLDTVGTLLLPLFFVTVGLAVDIRSLTAIAVVVLGCTLLAGASAKVGSVTATARLTGEEWRSAAAIGVLMNTRGLTELAVLDIGLSLGILSRPMFAVLVLASVATTTLTSPVLDRIKLPADADLLALPDSAPPPRRRPGARATADRIAS